MDSKKKWRGHSLGSLKKWICGLHFMKLFTKQSIRVMFFANIVTEPLHIHLLSANWRTAVQQSQWLDIYAINCRSNTLIVWYQIRSWLCRLGNIQLKLFFAETHEMYVTHIGSASHPSEPRASEPRRSHSELSWAFVVARSWLGSPWPNSHEPSERKWDMARLFANPD